VGQGVKKNLRILDLSKKHLREIGEQVYETFVLDTRLVGTKVKSLFHRRGRNVA
jgi:hypothetical protein